jgi:hypothetical protein
MQNNDSFYRTWHWRKVEFLINQRSWNHFQVLCLNLHQLIGFCRPIQLQVQKPDTARDDSLLRLSFKDNNELFLLLQNLLNIFLVITLKPSKNINRHHVWVSPSCSDFDKRKIRLVLWWGCGLQWGSGTQRPRRVVVHRRQANQRKSRYPT